jgi:hypothetical protein
VLAVLWLLRSPILKVRTIEFLHPPDPAPHLGKC